MNGGQVHQQQFSLIVIQNLQVPSTFTRYHPQTREIHNLPSLLVNSQRLALVGNRMLDLTDFLVLSRRAIL